MSRSWVTGSRTTLPEIPSLPVMQLRTAGTQSAGRAVFTIGVNVSPSVEYVATRALLPAPPPVPAAAASYSSNSWSELVVRLPLTAYHCRSTGVFGAAAQFVDHVVPSSVLTLLERLVRPCRSVKYRLLPASATRSV